MCMYMTTFVLSPNLTLQKLSYKDMSVLWLCLSLWLRGSVEHPRLHQHTAGVDTEFPSIWCWLLMGCGSFFQWLSWSKCTHWCREHRGSPKCLADLCDPPELSKHGVGDSGVHEGGVAPSCKGCHHVGANPSPHGATVLCVHSYRHQVSPSWCIHTS